MSNLDISLGGLSSHSIDKNSIDRNNTDKHINVNQSNITDKKTETNSAEYALAAEQVINATVDTESAAQNKPVSTEEIEKSVQDLNHFMQSMKRNLSFSFDDELGRGVVAVKDIESDEVIRQIPSEELVVLIKKMDDVAGILFDKKV